MTTVEKISVITCPYCGSKKEDEMPLDACLYFYSCKNCGKVIKPKEGIVVFFVPMAIFPARRNKQIKIAVK